MELTTYKKKRIIPKDWKEIKLGEEFKTSSGATPLSTKREYYEGGTISWINSGELDSPFIYKAANFITQKGFDNSSTTIYPQDTILVAMYGATAGKASLLKMEACTNQAICAILPNKDYSPEFIKYNLDTLYDHLVGLSSGSARDNLSQAGIKELKLIVPQTKREQESLVTILSLIDKKIELNRQINDNLEAMAKQLYDYWFVQFDFPNEEGKPYKSSGGAMVWNEKLKREIPQGWGTQNLADCLKLKTERVNSKDIKDTDNYTPIEVIPRKQMSLHETVALENAMSGICRYSRRNILLSNRRVYFHKVCIAPFDGLTRDTVLVLEPYNSGNLGYLYETVFADEFILFATKHSYGSEQPVLSWTAAQKFNVLRPSYSIDKKYSEIVDSIIESVLNNQIEIIKLTKQRDELLPLLMNGQASVNYHLSAKTEITFGRYDGRRNRFFPILITISTTNIVLLA